MIFPFRYRSIFRSRWIALLWAGGIVWLAISTIGPQQSGGGNNAEAQAPQTDALGQPVDPKQVKQLEDRLKQLGN